MARPSSTLLCQLVMTDSDLRYGLHAEGRDDLEDADDDQPDASDPDHDSVGRHRVHEDDHAADEQNDTEEDVPPASVLVREALQKSGESLKEESDADKDSQQPLATQTGVGAGRKQAQEDRQRTGDEVEGAHPTGQPRSEAANDAEDAGHDEPDDEDDRQELAGRRRVHDRPDSKDQGDGSQGEQDPPVFADRPHQVVVFDYHYVRVRHARPPDAGEGVSPQMPPQC